MKYFSKIKRIHNCWNQLGKEYAVSDIFLSNFFSCAQQLKITKLPTREKFESRVKTSRPQYSHGENLDSRNTTRKCFGPQNTHETRCYDVTRRRKPMMAQDPRKLAHFFITFSCNKLQLLKKQWRTTFMTLLLTTVT